MGVVENLAVYYGEISGVKGFPWETMRANKQTFASGYYLTELQEADQAAAKVIFESGLGLEKELSSVAPRSGRTAVTVAYESILRSSTNIYEAIQRGEWSLAVDKAMSMPVDALKMMLAATALFSMNGANLHYSGSYQDAITLGMISERQAEEHASHLLEIFRTITHIDREGGFEELRGTGQSGLGIAPLMIPGWILGSVVFLVGIVAITGLAALYMHVQQANKTQERVSRICDEQINALEAGSDERMAMITRCETAKTEMINATMTSLWTPVTASATTVAMFGGVGLLAWIVVRFVAPAGVKLMAEKGDRL